jgi:RsiW-degrading membrane proteinase PrsW (M82 family)
MSDTTSELTATPQPIGRPRLVDPQSLVFWLFAAVVVFSGLQLYHWVTDNPLLAPAIAWMALVQWAIYGGLFLAVVYRHQLFVQRPLSLTFAALAWGGLVAMWFSIEADQMLESIFTDAISPEWNDRWGLAVSGATNEEILKALGVIVLVLLPLVRVRSALDGWYYGMMVGLGFQVVEDYTYTVGQANTTDEVLGFLYLRGLVAGLWAHAVYTGLVGFGIGYLVARRDRTMIDRVGVAVGLFAFAWTMHFFWDSPILADWGERSSLAFYSTILLKGLPALVVLLGVLRWGRDHERTVWSDFVEQHIDPSLVPAEDRTSLSSQGGRGAARRAARASGGRTAGRVQHDLQQAQLRYVQSVMEEGAGSDRAQALATDIRQLRSWAEVAPAPAR